MKQNRLRRLLKARDITMTELASAVGVNISMISRYADGSMTPTPWVAARIAEFFGGAISEMELLYPERYPDLYPEEAEERARVIKRSARGRKAKALTR